MIPIIEDDYTATLFWYWWLLWNYMFCVMCEKPVCVYYGILKEDKMKKMKYFSIIIVASIVYVF